jgi:2'-5' RNA ligase
MHRHILYFAIHADAAAAAQVAELMTAFRRRDTPAGRAVGPEALHISLNNIGEFDAYPDAAVLRATEAAARVRVPPFTVALNRLAAWQNTMPGQRPLVLHGDEGVMGVERLYDAIGDELAEVGLRPPGVKATVPAHMTLARGVAEMPPEVVAPISWQVREFAFIHVPPGDQRHVLQRFPLSA